jgi:hypothetical protein
MSEDTSDRSGAETEKKVGRMVSGHGGTIVIVAVVLALTLLMAFNMN